MAKKKPRKIVAAGWYVGAGLGFLFAGIPPAMLSNAPTRILLCLMGVMCLCGAAYEWWFRKDDSPKLNHGEQLLISVTRQLREDRLVDAAQTFERTAHREVFQKYARHPIVEPEVISDAGARSVRLFLVNIGDEPAVDVTIAPIGEDSISFVPIRVLRPSDPKTEVQVFFHDAAAYGFLSPFAKGLLVAKMSYKVGWESGIDRKIKFANYVPVCLTYGDSLGRRYHTHDYVFADVSNHQVVIRRKLDSEPVCGPSPDHPSQCPYCRPGKSHPELRKS